LEREWKKMYHGWASQGPGGKKPHEDDEPGKDDHQTPPSINHHNPFKRELGFEKIVKTAEENLATMISNGEQIATGLVSGEWKLYSSDYLGLYIQTQSSLNYHPDRPYKPDYSEWDTGILRLGKHCRFFRVTGI
jgi:hypothetical protein